MVVLFSLLSRDLNLLLQLAEGCGLSRFILFKEFKHFLDALLVKLLTDLVEVFGLVAPKFNFSGRKWVLAVLQRALGVLFQDVLDLLLPVDDGG